MSSRRIDDQLRAARPPDPVGEDLQSASVRVIARLAMLEAGSHAAVPARRTHVLVKVAAAAILLLVPLFAARSVQVTAVPSPEEIAVVPAVPDPLALQVEAAVRGDPLARRRVLDEGRRARRALLDHAASRKDGAAEALVLLRAAGGVRDDAEAERLGELALWPDTQEAAIDLLAAAPTVAGIRILGRVLVTAPTAEVRVVEALVRAARHGRRPAALRALVGGAAAGRVDAAAAAVALGNGRAAIAVLGALPPDGLADPRFVAACKEASATTQDLLLRRAAGGDDRALAVAVAARMPGVVPILTTLAVDGDVEAVDALRRQASGEAWLGLADALHGEAASAARAALDDAPASAVRHLEQVARVETSRRVLALDALSAAGLRGIAALERLAARSSLTAPVIDVLGRSTTPRSAELLGTLAANGRDEDRATVALARRLEAGDRSAGAALTTLVRNRGSRRALRLLARHGPGAGVEWLASVVAEPTLPASARATLTRALRRARAERDDEAMTAARRARPSTKPAPIT